LIQVAATIISNEQLLGEYWIRKHRKYLGAWLMRLKCPEIVSKAKPGQFIMIRCDGECVLPRPFSIHNVNNEGIALCFVVRDGGKGTTWLSQRAPNDEVEFFGPLGNGYTLFSNSKKLLLVAGGMGLAPLCFLAQEKIKNGCSVTLLYGTANESRYSDNLLPAGIKLVTVTENGIVGRKGMVTDILPEFVAQADQIFACGPLPMYKAMAQMPELKDKSVQVSLETRMGCGLGVCYGCTIKTRSGLKQVCRDGPVFDLKDIIWDELIA
jgi:dihydroorotate dehydrogenase electron transfer subunit